MPKQQSANCPTCGQHYLKLDETTKMSEYLCIARRDLREGPDLEIGFYSANTPDEAIESVRKNFPESHLGVIAVYEVDNQTCDVTLKAKALLK